MKRESRYINIKRIRKKGKKKKIRIKGGEEGERKEYKEEIRKEIREIKINGRERKKRKIREYDEITR